MFLLLAAVSAGVAVGGTTSDDVFGPYNYEWDGTSDLRKLATEEGVDTVILRDPSTYEEFGEGAVAFVIAPERSLSEDTTDIVEFVDRGGTLIVAYRNDPSGDALLSDLGVGARPDGALLRDELNYYKSPRLPIATGIGDHELVDGVSSVTLNHGTTVNPNGSTVLIESSPYSYLGMDASGELNEEQVAPFPVATVEPVGDGQVVVVGDPSIFINVMQDQSGNKAFTRALISGNDHVIVDASGDSTIPLLVSIMLTVRENPLLQAAVGIGALLAVGLLTNLTVRIWSQSG